MSHDERRSPLRDESPSPRSVDDDRQGHGRYSIHDDRREHDGRLPDDEHEHDLRQRDGREDRDDRRYRSDDDHDVSDDRHHRYPDDHTTRDHMDERHNRLENHEGDRHDMKERDERDDREEQYSIREPLGSSPGRELVSNEENEQSRQDTRQHSPPNDSSNSHAVNAQASAEANGESTLVNLFVRNVAKHVLEDQLISLFSKYGKVESAVVVRDPHSRECRGFGFVKMMSDKDAQQAIDNLQEFEFEGRHISVERAKRNGPHSRTPGAYMGLDRRIRDRYVGMKRSREYAYTYGPPYPPPPPHYAPYRGPRYHDGPRPRYDYRQMQAPPHDYNRPPMNQRYDQRGSVDDRDRQRRRYDTDGPRYSPREASRDQRIDGRDPPVPRESADDVI